MFLRQIINMPFLHGFRRIIFEYQPLVDEILGSMGILDPERHEGVEVERYHPTEDDAMIQVLTDVLKRKAHLPFYQDGVSYSLLKIAELGLVRAAEVLLEHGADLNFEDPVTYYTPLHIAVLRKQTDIVELFVKCGADLNRRDRIHESSPLDLASEDTERLPCLRRLLHLGADVNAADRNGKTALLHALASSDGLLIHNTENIRYLLEGGADVNVTTKDGDTVFTCIIFLLGEAVAGDTQEACVISSFCFKVTQLLMAHHADPSECPSHESLTHTCLKGFKYHFPLLRFLLESGASSDCTLHGPACWSGFQIVIDKLCSQLNCSAHTPADVEDLLQKAETVLELMAANSPRVKLPDNFQLSTASCTRYADKVSTLYQYLKQLAQSPPLKHLCRVAIRKQLTPWPLDVKVKALPLPDLMKVYLLVENTNLGSV